MHMTRFAPNRDGPGSCELRGRSTLPWLLAHPSELEERFGRLDQGRLSGWLRAVRREKRDMGFFQCFLMFFLVFLFVFLDDLFFGFLDDVFCVVLVSWMSLYNAYYVFICFFC